MTKLTGPFKLTGKTIVQPAEGGKAEPILVGWDYQVLERVARILNIVGCLTENELSEAIAHFKNAKNLEEIQS